MLQGTRPDWPVGVWFGGAAGRPPLFSACQRLCLWCEEAALKRWPQMRVAFDALAGKVSAEEMQEMNEAVDGENIVILRR